MGQSGFSRGGALAALVLSASLAFGALGPGAQAQRGGGFIPYYDAPANPAHQGIAVPVAQPGTRLDHTCPLFQWREE